MLPAEKFEELPSSSLNLHFSTILGTIIKCEQCSGITMESGTPIKKEKKYHEFICSVVSFMCNFHLEWSRTFFISYEYRKPQITAY